MRPQLIRTGLAITTAAMGMALLLTACGPGQPQTQQTTSADSPSPGSASPTGSGAPTASQAPTSPAATPGGPALCKAATLTAATDASGGGAAGSVYMQLLLTNSGAETCLLRGFPGVSLTAGAASEPIGAPAKRDDTKPVADVVLAPGQTGSATLRYTQAANYPDCDRTPAAGFRIYPPEDTASLFLPEQREACSNASVTLLSVGAFQAQ